MKRRAHIHTKKCSCGTLNQINAKYCQECGKKLGTETSALKVLGIIGILAFLFFGILAGVGMMMAPASTYDNTTMVEPVTPEEPAAPAPAPVPELTEAEIIQEKYDEIYSIPYVEDMGPAKTPEETLSMNQGDCDDKAVLFADWLCDQGYTDVYIVCLYSSKANYGHAIVEFNGGFYDLTDPVVYNASEEEAMGYYLIGGWETYEKYQYFSGMQQYDPS